MHLSGTIFGMMLGAALAVPASADGPLDPLSFLGPCLTPTSDIDVSVAALELEGWRIADPVPLQAIVGLAWIGTAYYFSTDSGGESVADIFALQEKSARGLIAKKDIPQSKTRILTKESGGMLETLALLWRQPQADVTEVECKTAVGPSSMQHIRAEMVLPDDLRSFHVADPVELTGGPVYITLLDRDALGTQAAPDAVVQTYIKYEAGG